MKTRTLGKTNACASPGISKPELVQLLSLAKTEARARRCANAIYLIDVAIVAITHGPVSG
jgi:hypothetical protein